MRLSLTAHISLYKWCDLDHNMHTFSHFHYLDQTVTASKKELRMTIWWYMYDIHLIELALPQRGKDWGRDREEIYIVCTCMCVRVCVHVYCTVCTWLGGTSTYGHMEHLCASACVGRRGIWTNTYAEKEHYAQRYMYSCYCKHVWLISVLQCVFAFLFSTNVVNLNTRLWQWHDNLNMIRKIRQVHLHTHLICF